MMWYKFDLPTNAIESRWVVDKETVIGGIKWGYVHLGTTAAVEPSFQEWLDNHCKIYWVRPMRHQIIFFRKQDAVLFKLRWG